jgi:Fe-S cluster assembly protein SufD
MIETMSEKDVYLANYARFEKSELCAGDPAWLRQIREAAIERFADLGFPTARNEDWKFTSVAPLARVPFKHAGNGGEYASDRVWDLARDAGELDAGQCGIIFVNGACDSPLLGGGSSERDLPPGVILRNLRGVLPEYDPADNVVPWRDALVKPYLAQIADYENHPFAALNTAFLLEGAFLYVPKDTIVEKPIHLVYGSVTPDGPTVSHPRNLIVVGNNSRLTLVESYIGQKGDVYFTNAVTEIVAGENAVIDHYKVQRESRAAFHVATTQVQQQRGSNFSTHYLGFGGILVRNEVRVRFEGEGAEATVNGLYMAGSTQHMDNHTVIDHARPHCASHELYKGVLSERARGVFNGKIFVRPDAQKTDAKQTNKTLLLSDDATINTKPQLEIYADDVKCTHGATVGNLDEEQLFYLRARGIDLAAARALLTFAFANDIVGRIKVAPLRAQLERQLLPAGYEAEEAV